MPCYDPPLTAEEERREYQKNREDQLKEFTHNSPVAEMLCALVTRLGDTNKLEDVLNNIDEKVEARLRHWWIEHKRRDDVKTKKEREAIERAHALAALTPKQRKILGLPNK